MKMNTKKIVAVCMVFCVMAVICCSTVSTNAATKQSKIRKAYAEKIKKCKNMFPDDEYFLVKDIDKDGIPELILYWDEANSNASNVSGLDFEGSLFSSEMMVYTYKNGKVKKVCGDGYTYIGIYFKHSVIEKYVVASYDCKSSTYYKYSHGKLSGEIASCNQDDGLYSYKINKKRTTEAKFDKKRKSITSGNTTITIHKATNSNIKKYCTK